MQPTTNTTPTHDRSTRLLGAVDELDNVKEYTSRGSRSAAPRATTRVADVRVTVDHARKGEVTQ